MSAPEQQNGSQAFMAQLTAAAGSDGNRRPARQTQSPMVPHDRMNRAHAPPAPSGHNQGAHIFSHSPITSNSNGVSSSYNGFDGYTITQRDMERMVRNRMAKTGPATNVSRPVSTPPTMPSQPLPAHSVKRTLDPPQQHYAPGQGPPPKKGFLAVPVLRSQHAVSEGIAAPSQKFSHPNAPADNKKDRRLSLEAARHGVHNLDLSASALKGIGSLPDEGISPGHAKWAGISPTYAEKLLQMREAFVATGGELTKTVKEMDEEERRSWLIRSRVATTGNRGRRQGMRQDQAELRGVPKRMVDATASWEHRFRHLQQDTRPRSSIPRSDIRFIELEDSEYQPFDMREVLDTVRTSYDFTWSESEDGVLPPSTPEALQMCDRDEDGGYRAPEPRGLGEHRAELLWLLKACGRNQELGWVQDEDGEWRRPRSAGELETLKVHAPSSF